MGLAYDAGMNNGDDTAYYLAKGYDVVAIDANPRLCETASRRFADHIAKGRLTILNIGLSDAEGSATFHINEGDDAISSFAPHRFADQAWVDQRWTPISVRTRPLSHVIAEHGAPDFLKIDVEFHDTRVLLDLLRHGLAPPYISVEAQELDVFCALVCLGYSQFRLSCGEEVPTTYGAATIATLAGQRMPYAFQPFSSGPFGDDLLGPWRDRDETLAALQQQGFGWIDIHARRS